MTTLHVRFAKEHTTKGWMLNDNPNSNQLMGRVEHDHPFKIPMFLYNSPVSEHEALESNITSTMKLYFFGNEHLICNKNDRPKFTARIRRTIFHRHPDALQSEKDG